MIKSATNEAAAGMAQTHAWRISEDRADERYSPHWCCLGRGGAHEEVVQLCSWGEAYGNGQAQNLQRGYGKEWRAVEDGPRRIGVDTAKGA